MREGVKLGFTTLDREISFEILNIKGELPQWLTGVYIRNGPAKFEAGGEKYRHWFDGLAMLIRFSFKDHKIYFSNRFLQSKAFKKAVKTKHIYYSEFATNPTSTLRCQYLKYTSQLTDNASVNVFKVGDHFVAMTETPDRVAFDPYSLETLGTFHYDGKIWGHLTTAHPHITEEGEIYNYITRFSLTSTYNIFRIGARGKKREMITSIPVKEPSYMHSIGMTENYIILAEYPLVIQPLKLLASNKPFVDNLYWRPDRGTKFTVVDKRNGSIVGRYEAEAFFAFHHINAYEEGDKICVDLVAYRDASLASSLYLKDLINPDFVLPVPEVRRYYLPRGGTGLPQFEVISEQFPEFPRINYSKKNTRPYRFVYGVNAYQSKGFNNSLVKLDVVDRGLARWFEENCYPGEPMFIPRPDGTEEDDGVVLSVVLDTAKNKSYLLILDARSFEERARAEMPYPIPFGSHGQYFEF
ncbi:MAG: carotenoid oxygenase family protein [Bacillota bacterium]